MPRARRRIISGQPYELILRVSNRLPFVPLELINFIIKSTMARAQRDYKLIICHYLWMGNHLHLILIPLDPQQCVNFYQEIQKKITDAFKRLLGVEYLNLWDGSPVLAQILDPDKVIEKIGYAYANPAEASLVDKIEDYPGVSSYNQFINSENSVYYQATESVPRIRLNRIPKLPALKLSESKDRELTNGLLGTATMNHNLTISPNAWMGCFGIKSPEEVALTNKQILETIRRLEQRARDSRTSLNHGVLGARRLKSTPILSKCNSKKRERRVFFHSTFRELREAFLADFRYFCDRCDSCYQFLKKGVLTDWPPGAFRPPAPPLASALG